MIDAIGPIEDPSLPQKVILVFRSAGGWHLETVLARVEQQHVMYLPPWNEPWSDAGSDADWRYLKERVIDGRGGNGQTYEVEGFGAALDVNIDAIVVARAAEVVASTGGPFGEVAQTITFGDGEDIVSMPFVVLFDEETDLMLVATDAVGHVPVTVVGDATTEHSQMTFRSLTHWQRDHQRCWPLDPGVEHAITWDTGKVFLTVDEMGAIVRLARHASSPTVPEPEAEPIIVIDRFDLPTWASFGGASETSLTMSGEESVWGWAIPDVLRAAGAPQAVVRWPIAPTKGAGIEAATGYWEALLHLLLYSFGWARPDLGLQWWQRSGYPTDDHRLRLVADTYLADGQLDWIAAWLASMSLPLDAHAEVHALAGYINTSAPAEVDTDWLARTDAAASSSGIPTPLNTGDGYDPLHLGSHTAGPLAAPEAPTQLRRTSRDRTAVLLTDSAVGWYRSLVEHGQSLQGATEQTWRVDVVVKPIGWLGTYRRSRRTGLWYSGPHRLHTRGC